MDQVFACHRDGPQRRTAGWWHWPSSLP